MTSYPEIEAYYEQNLAALVLKWDGPTLAANARVLSDITEIWRQLEDAPRADSQALRRRATTIAQEAGTDFPLPSTVQKFLYRAAVEPLPKKRGRPKSNNSRLRAAVFLYHHIRLNPEHPDWKDELNHVSGDPGPDRAAHIAIGKVQGHSEGIWYGSGTVIKEASSDWGKKLRRTLEFQEHIPALLKFAHLW